MARLTRGEIVQFIAGAVLILISFIPLWGSYSSMSRSGEVLGHGDLDGWGSYGFATNLALLLSVSVVLLILSRAIGMDLDVPRRDATYSVLTSAITVLLFAALVGGPVFDVPGRGQEHDVTRGPLAYLSLAVACVGLVGARMHRSVAPTVDGKRKPDRTTQATNSSRGIDGAR